MSPAEWPAGRLCIEGDVGAGDRSAEVDRLVASARVRFGERRGGAYGGEGDEDGQDMRRRFTRCSFFRW